MGATYHAPKIGAMNKFRLSIYDPKQVFLRDWLIEQRKNAQLTQRQLAERLHVVHSLVGKVEKGERRLDILEFRTYCHALEVKPSDFFNLLDREND